MSSETVVVGGGIAGITAAYFESINGQQVKLIESDSRAGGLLKSDRGHDRYFDYGTHIYAETGVAELDEFLFSTCEPSNCNYHDILTNGNFFRGVLNSKNGYVDSSVLVDSDYYRGCVELLSTPDLYEVDELRSYLKLQFGAKFYDCIFKNVVKKYFGLPAERLSPFASVHFDMQRVLAFDESTTRRLATITEYDAKLGLHSKGPGSRKYYPKWGGVGWLIDELMQKLTKLGVQFQPSTMIRKIIQKEGHVYEIVTDGGVIQTDRLIWTLPQILLMRLIGENLQMVPMQHRNTGLFDYAFERPLNSEVLYINVYDTEYLSGRITLYQNLTRSANYSCTVEVLADQNVDLAVKIDHVLDELIRMGLVDKLNRCKFQQFRSVERGFPVLTLEAVQGFDELYEHCNHYFKNVVFLGRSPGIFFMSDILVDAYRKIASKN